jgi:hypothetical protein
MVPQGLALQAYDRDGTADPLVILRDDGHEEGLARFLAHTRRLTGRGGQLLLNSVDVRQTDDPVHLAYHQRNRQAGRCVGAVRIRLEYQGHRGPYCGWLHVDQETLAQHARSGGWDCAIVLEQEGGEYLARLTPSGTG